MNEKKDKKPWTYWLFYICGSVVMACLAICIMAVMIALTYKFVGWLF